MRVQTKFISVETEKKTHGLFHDTQLHVFMFLGYLGDVNFNDIININIDYKI